LLNPISRINRTPTVNSRQRIQAVIEGLLPDWVSVCLHNFLPAAREAGVSMEEYRTDPTATGL
jgi:hypothetical protein